MLNNIRIVLINTSHPGNIGSVARAMKTMGLTRLYLVEPGEHPHPKAVEMASNAGDILDKAVVVNSFADATADCSLVVGTSARNRAIPWPIRSPRELAEAVAGMPSTQEIAIVFGRERTGLTNDELQCCHWHIQIPANPDYSSLNLAAAVQVIAYELRVACVDKPDVVAEWDYPPATAEDMERLFVHLQSVLIAIEFLKPSAPRKLMTRFRRLFYRAHPDVMEANMLRGMLTAIEETIKS